MRDGLYVSSVTLTGLRDKFGNSGGTGTGTWNGVISMNSSSYNCPNLVSDIKVDALSPMVNSRNPASNNTPTGNNAISSITINFNEPVMKGNGTITIRPRGNYAIPPVLEDDGYYLGTDGTTRYTSAATGTTKDRTYISSFYDIYNNTSLTTAERGYLLAGTSMSSHNLNARTGQSAGPYKKTTHGLTGGLGYSGNYSGANVTSGANAPDAVSGYVIPDTATKWVLDYQYLINDTGTDVTRIRGVLTKAKWRWQEIDVANITLAATGNAAVTIDLSEPLLKGLEWDVYYPAGTFTDMAGNPAAACGSFDASGNTTGTNTDYYFTTPGVQPPVIRVNRRSYDARNSQWSQTTGGGNTYADPTSTGTWDATTAAVSFAVPGAAGDLGWGINHFKTIHYRVESESPGVTITVGTSKGTTANRNSASGAWDGSTTVLAANTGATSVNSINWNAAATNTPGTWILSNIIRRSRDNANQTYTVITKNGIPESRTSTTAGGTLRMFRSYNRDITQAELNSISLAAGSNGYQGTLTFNALESNKSYVAAQATKNNQSAKGYEGIYRTVIALNFSQAKGGQLILIEGSNVKNGMPSVAGFPVRDAEETGDRRFVKAFYNGTDDGGTVNRTYYWVSTEIVCEWYFLYWGGGGSHQRVGEVNNYLTVGYGDLTYAYDLESY